MVLPVARCIPGTSLLAITDAEGAHRFEDLARGDCLLRVDRFGYRSVTLETTLDREEPLSVSVLLEPAPFPLPPLESPGRDGPGGRPFCCRRWTLLRSREAPARRQCASGSAGSSHPMPVR